MSHGGQKLSICFFNSLTTWSLRNPTIYECYVSSSFPHSSLNASSTILSSLAWLTPSLIFRDEFLDLVFFIGLMNPCSNVFAQLHTGKRPILPSLFPYFQMMWCRRQNLPCCGNQSWILLGPSVIRWKRSASYYGYYKERLDFGLGITGWRDCTWPCGYFAPSVGGCKSGRGFKDVVHHKASPFSTSHLIWVNCKV